MLTSGMKEVDKESDKRMGRLFDELLEQAPDNCWNNDEYDFSVEQNQKAVRWYASNLSENASPATSDDLATDVQRHRHSSDISIDRAIGISLKKKNIGT